MTRPGQDTNPSQLVVLIYTAESIGASRVKCLAQGYDTTVRSGFELTTFAFGLRV